MDEHQAKVCKALVWAAALIICVVVGFATTTCSYNKRVRYETLKQIVEQAPDRAVFIIDGDRN